jgi:hypothetical protein
MAQQRAAASTVSVTVNDTVKAEVTETTLLDAVAAPTKPGPMGTTFLPSKTIPGVKHAKYPARRAFAQPKFQVLTNHFEVTFKPDTHIYVYEIDGIPAGKSKLPSRLGTSCETIRTASPPTISRRSSHGRISTKRSSWPRKSRAT